MRRRGRNYIGGAKCAMHDWTLAPLPIAGTCHFGCNRCNGSHSRDPDLVKMVCDVLARTPPIIHAETFTGKTLPPRRHMGWHRGKFLGLFGRSEGGGALLLQRYRWRRGGTISPAGVHGQCLARLFAGDQTGPALWLSFLRPLCAGGR